jgi:hypothetical protein
MGRAAGTASSLSLGRAQLALASQQEDAFFMADANPRGGSRRGRNSTNGTDAAAAAAAAAAGSTVATTTPAAAAATGARDATTTTAATSGAKSRDEAVGFLPVALLPGRPGAGVPGAAAPQLQGAPSCPLSSQLRAPRPVYLMTCAEYAGESCCTQDEDAALRAMLQLHFEPVYALFVCLFVLLLLLLLLLLWWWWGRRS